MALSGYSTTQHRRLSQETVVDDIPKSSERQTPPLLKLEEKETADVENPAGSLSKKTDFIIFYIRLLYVKKYCLLQ